MLEIGIGVVAFTTIVTALVLLILAAKWALAPAGDVTIQLNDSRNITAAAGTRLLSALTDSDVLLPSACGGRGTCGQCTVTVLDGAGPPLAIETSLLTRQQLSKGERLACQVTLRRPLVLQVPAEILGVRKWRCTVHSNHSVATLMKELVLDLPAGERIAFRAGCYVQASCPPHRTAFTGFDIDAEYRAEWDRLGLWSLVAATDVAASRAYSIASNPADDDRVTLVVRIATPPPGVDETIPPGVVSSYLFGLQPGDQLVIAGPYGSFVTSDSDREMVFIGGGAGVAPLRSMILDLVVRARTPRTISFWYGARNARELCYREEFERLEDEFSNFDYTVALSEPQPQDAWQGEVGFIHEILERQYLRNHASPERCEYYLCGPPLMIKAVLALLERYGVDRESIRFDDFGS
jgi:Na+-transporting NADH:ubiquinone oxidoreductase subunit F